MTRLVVLAALTLAVSGLAPAAAPRQPNPVEELAALVAQYRRGDATGAVLRLATWDEKRLAEAPGLAKSLDAPPSLAALALLHTEVGMLAGALSALPPIPQAVAYEHARVALRHVQALGARFGTNRDVRTFCREWYVLAISLRSQFGRLAEARTLARAGRTSFGDDAAILLAAGSAAEAMIGPYPNVGAAAAAVAPTPVSAEDCLRTSWGLLTIDRQEAENLLRRALVRDPQLVEARVRLGHVLLVEDRPKEAQRELERALDDARSVRHTFAAYHAALFLGQLHQHVQRVEAAQQAYNTAIGIYPGGQSAYLALGHLLVVAGRQDDGWASVRRMFGDGGAPPGSAPDLWRLYNGAQFWQTENRLRWLRAWVRR